MGIFYDMKKVRNLAPVPLTARFDGQEMTIPVGESSMPAVAVTYAMNQNPVMGSADGNNPNISGGRYLIVPVGSKYDRAALTQEEWEAHTGAPCRIDHEAFFADRLGPKEHIIFRGSGRRTQAKSLWDAGVHITAPETLSHAGD